MSVTVELIDTAGFAPLVVSAAHIYGEAMQRSPEMVVQRREIMQSHLGRDGFRAVVARDAGELVGFGYGYRGRTGEWWHDTVSRRLGNRLGKKWMSDAFELAELHVLPAYQSRGLGRTILTTLLEQCTGGTVILSTHDRESPARALYRSLGFVDLATGFVFPGSSEVYTIMGLALSTAAARPT